MVRKEGREGWMGDVCALSHGGMRERAVCCCVVFSFSSEEGRLVRLGLVW